MSDGMYDARAKARVKSVRPGDIYKHFRGEQYIIIALAKSSEDPYDRDLRKVVYMRLSDGEIYHRDMYEFIEVVNREETGFRNMPRFTFVAPQSTILVDERGNYNVKRRY